MTDGDTKDPETVIKDFEKQIGISSCKESTQKSLKTFEYRIEDLIIEIKLDTVKNYICLLTRTDLNIDFKTDRTKALYYVAYINEEFSVTCLDVDPENGEFKLKSSQSFPSGMNFGAILDYFWKRHRLEFPLIKESIIEFNNSISNPQTFDNFEPRNLAKEFHTKLNSIPKNI